MDRACRRARPSPGSRSLAAVSRAPCVLSPLSPCDRLRRSRSRADFASRCDATYLAWRRRLRRQSHPRPDIPRLTDFSTLGRSTATTAPKTPRARTASGKKVPRFLSLALSLLFFAKRVRRSYSEISSSTFW